MSAGACPAARAAINQGETRDPSSCVRLPRPSPPFSPCPAPASWPPSRSAPAPTKPSRPTIDGANVSITYGRPYAKGRKIFGGLVPYGQVWRTGADEATILETDKALMIGPLHVNPGKISLYSLVDEKTWKLVLNKQVGQWGTEYSQAQDLGRVDMKTEKLAAPVEQLTIAIDKNPAGKGGLLVVQWETTKASLAVHHDVEPRRAGPAKVSATARPFADGSATADLQHRRRVALRHLPHRNPAPLPSSSPRPPRTPRCRRRRRCRRTGHRA